MDLIREIERLKAEGYSNIKVGEKLDICEGTVKGMLALKKSGEERVLDAALSGRVPITVAIEIARANTAEAQRALLKAFENKQLNYVSIRAVKRLIDQRTFFGKQLRRGSGNKRKDRNSSEYLVNIFKRETERQRLLVKKAQLCEAKLACVVTALNKLLADLNFMNLLRSESLATMPQYLWTKLETKPREAM